MCKLKVLLFHFNLCVLFIFALIGILPFFPVKVLSEEIPQYAMDDIVKEDSLYVAPEVVLEAMQMLEAMDNAVTSTNEFIKQTDVVSSVFEYSDDKVIFGDNDLQDHYEVGAIPGSWGDAVCAFVPDNMVEWNGSEWEIVNPDTYDSREIALFDPASPFSTLHDRPFCDEESFVGQYTAPFCSGFLVGSNLIATAGHCVESPITLDDFVIIFGYVQQSAAVGDARLTFPSTHVYWGNAIKRFRYDPGNGIDHALIELDRPIEISCVWPLPVQREQQITPGTQVGTIGYPQGLPRKYAFGADTVVQQVVNRNQFIANMDSYKGNSGAPVINPATGVVEGVLDSGPDVEFGGSINGFTEDPSVDPCATDTEAPVIILIGDTAMSLVLCAADPLPELPGATAWDACEGNLTATLTVTGEVTTAPGVYTLTYGVSDSSGNAATPVERTVTVTVPAGPYIYVPTRSLTAHCGRYGDLEFPPGELRDGCSGTVLESVTPGLDNYSAVGYATLSYEHPSAQTAVAYISKMPESPPEIEVLSVNSDGESRNAFILGATFIENRAQATDGCGSITTLDTSLISNRHVDISQVIPTQAGAYPVIYRFTDDYGIPAKPVVEWVFFDPCAVTVSFENDTNPARYIRVNSIESFSQYIPKLPYESLPKGVEFAIKRGICYLKESQRPDGSWRLDAYPDNDQFIVGTTALAVLALLKNGEAADETHVYNALNFIAGEQYEDGSYGRDVIAFPGALATSWTEETALAMMALLASKNPIYHEDIALASSYLLSTQRTPANYPDLYVDEPFISLWDGILGGWGHPFTNRDGEVNMTSTFWALVALDQAFRISPSLTDFIHPLSWTQPAMTVLDYHQKWFSPGGFFESTDLVNPFGPICLTDHGRPTAAGLYANLVCGRGMAAPQVQDALSWLGENFRTDKHPQDQEGTNGDITYRTLGMDYFFTYCLNLAAAMSLAGEDALTRGGSPFSWYPPVAEKLVDLQKSDGYWLNTEAEHGGERFFPAMVTSMALLTLLSEQIADDEETSLSVFLEPAGKDEFLLDLHIYDPANRHLGMNSSSALLDTEIPGAYLIVDGNGAQRAVLPELESGSYRIELTGTTAMSYSLRVDGYATGGAVTSRCMSNIYDPAAGFSANVVVAAPFGNVNYYMHDIVDTVDCEGELEPEGELEGEGEEEGEGEPVEGEGEISCTASSPYPADDPCYQEVVLNDSYCCENEWDAACQLDYNTCVSSIEGEGESEGEGEGEGEGEEVLVAVPDVAGMTQVAATDTLVGAGLIAGAITESYHATIAAGQVISQNPAADVMVLPGSAVDMVVSLGPQPNPEEMCAALIIAISPGPPPKSCGPVNWIVHEKAVLH